MVTAKTAIVVYAFHLYESCGGFFWCVDTPQARTELTELLRNDRASGSATSGSVLTLSVAGYSDDPKVRQSITDFIEGELQDAMEVGRVGRILTRYNDEPDEED